MGLVCAGRLNKQVAAEIGITEATAKVHRHNVMKKLGARTLPDLVRMADRLDRGPRFLMEPTARTKLLELEIVWRIAPRNSNAGRALGLSEPSVWCAAVGNRRRGFRTGRYEPKVSTFVARARGDGATVLASSGA